MKKFIETNALTLTLSHPMGEGTAIDCHQQLERLHRESSRRFVTTSGNSFSLSRPKSGIFFFAPRRERGGVRANTN
jgi:hypothetical protein